MNTFNHRLAFKRFSYNVKINSSSYLVSFKLTRLLTVLAKTLSTFLSSEHGKHCNNFFLESQNGMLHFILFAFALAL